tara:strand:- start:230 stop:1075 length:846 start_codon:yes stop_codon:yes gene_type:complete
LKHEFLLVEKNQILNKFITQNIDDYSINLFFYKTLLKILKISNIHLHYGKFEIKQKNNYYNLLKIITSPSNYFEKLTIVEGWSKNELRYILNDFFLDFDDLKYNEILADTYYFNYGSSFYDLKINMQNTLKKNKIKYNNHVLLNNFSFDEIIVIGSLLEKEGLDEFDKKKIFSVIINRLKKNMKLQIDATVIYALTDGTYHLNRKLTYNDLKYKHPFNTYFIYGLPPEPISYVGTKTIELIFENYKSDYLFYFYNDLKKEHEYSTSYKQHLKKLNDYRSKK